MDLNKAMLIGNLAVDPAVRVLPSGQKVAQFRVGTNRVWVDQGGNRQEEAQFHNITAFGRRAEVCEQYLKKGQKVYVEGRIRHSTYTTQDGQTKYWTEIIVENLIMLSPRSGTAPGTAPQDQQEQEAGPAGEGDFSQPAAEPVSPAANKEEKAGREATPVISEEEPSEVLKQEKSKEEEEEVSMEDIPF